MQGIFSSRRAIHEQGAMGYVGPDCDDLTIFSNPKKAVDLYRFHGIR